LTFALKVLQAADLTIYCLIFITVVKHRLPNTTLKYDPET